MPLRTSDLSYEAKQQLLKAIRDQIGSNEYNNIVETLGEDGLIDLALAKANRALERQTSKEEKRSWIIMLVEGALIAIAAFISFGSVFGDVNIPWKSEFWSEISLIFSWIIGWWSIVFFILAQLSPAFPDAIEKIMKSMFKPIKAIIIVPFKKKGVIDKIIEIIIIVYGISLFLALVDI